MLVSSGGDCDEGGGDEGGGRLIHTVLKTAALGRQCFRHFVLVSVGVG